MTSTAMAASCCATPAVRRDMTARRVYSEDHTAVMAVASASREAAGTPTLDSYRPAALMPARSSTLALDRTASSTEEPALAAALAGRPLAALDDAPNADATRSSTSGGITAPSTARCMRAHAASSAAPSRSGRSSARSASSNSNCALTPPAATASSSSPNGSTTPGGVVNRPVLSRASASSSPHLAALAPHVSVSASARGTTSQLLAFLVELTPAAPAAAARCLGCWPGPGDTERARARAAAVVPSVASRVTLSDATLSLTILPVSGCTLVRTNSESSHMANVTPSCRARTPRCDRCGSSCLSTTPARRLPSGPTSSSPSARATSSTTGSLWPRVACSMHSGLRLSTATSRPTESPVTRPSQASMPHAARSARTKMPASLDTWNATLARTSDSPKMRAMCSGTSSAPPRRAAGAQYTLITTSEYCDARRWQRSAVALARSAPSRPPRAMGPPGPSHASSSFSSTSSSLVAYWERPRWRSPLVSAAAATRHAPPPGPPPLASITAPPASSSCCMTRDSSTNT
mmetsp:Transcript_23335/g.59715  ORF Transcript_23335/g.59715 Transcript_23335/m.59715 type:complete len:521 (+) Transcript_23335:1220-2782(+)